MEEIIKYRKEQKLLKKKKPSKTVRNLFFLKKMMNSGRHETINGSAGEKEERGRNWKQ